MDIEPHTESDGQVLYTVLDDEGDVLEAGFVSKSAARSYIREETERESRIDQEAIAELDHDRHEAYNEWRHS